MKRFFLILVLISTFLSVFPHETIALQTELSSILSKDEVAQGDTVTLIVRLSWIGDPQALQIEPLKDLDTYLLEVVDVTQKNTFDMFNDLEGNTVLITYTLKATEPGEGRISYLALETTEQETGIKRIKKTQPYDVNILPKSRYLLRQTAYVIWYGLMLLGIIIVLGIIWRVYTRRKSKKEADAQEQAILAADVEKSVLMELKNARKHKISGDNDAFFAAVIAALNRYFEQKHSLSMLRTSSLSEDKIESQHNIPRKMFIEYKEIVAAANRTKFSGNKLTADELEQWARRAEKIIKFFMEKSREDQRKKQIDTITTVSDAGGN